MSLSEDHMFLLFGWKDVTCNFPLNSCILNNAQRFGLVRNVKHLFICLSVPHSHGGSRQEKITLL